MSRLGARVSDNDSEEESNPKAILLKRKNTDSSDQDDQRKKKKKEKKAKKAKKKEKKKSKKASKSSSDEETNTKKGPTDAPLDDDANQTAEENEYKDKQKEVKGKGPKDPAKALKNKVRKAKSRELDR